MQKLILVSLLTTLLFSQNPKVYSALGDVIYNNATLIEGVEDLDAMAHYKDKIKKYIQKVGAAKKQGFAIEEGDSSIDKKEYLSTLRSLSKENDFLLRMIRNKYTTALKNEDSQLFFKLINSGLIDTQEHKQEIIDYYFAHQDDMNTSGVIQAYLDEDAKLRARKEAELRNKKSKKQRELEKIRRIRAKDKKEQEALERKLQKELEQKKKEVLQKQKMELFKTK